MSGEEKKYTAADSIKVLEGLEAVRKRPGMYIGSTGERGLHHLIYEVVDNSIDESLAGYCSKITVTLHKDNSVSVEDNGRGIPVDIMPQYKKSGVEIVMTILHAGGKFDEGAYKVSGGLHGVGVSVVNALSEILEVWVYRDNNIHYQKYNRGKPMGELKVTGTTEKRGTLVKFLPDFKIFETLEFKYDTVIQRLRELAFLNRGVYIEIIDERSDKKEAFIYEGGIIEFVKYLNTSQKEIHEKVIYMEGSRDNISVEIAMQYNDGFQENIFSFANNINTHEGGTHLTGFKKALTRVINGYAEKNNIFKKDDSPFSGEDVREGLTSVISVKIPQPQFEIGRAHV